MKRLAVVLLLALSSCGGPERRQVEVLIVDVYSQGLFGREIRSVIEMPDGTRREIRGQRGDVGEKVRIWMIGDRYVEGDHR